MSRSKKKAIYKDKGIRPYWRFVRSRINQDIRNIVSLNDKEDYSITTQKRLYATILIRTTLLIVNIKGQN